MKRLLYVTLIVLFGLSGCAPATQGPATQAPAATSAGETTERTALVATLTGQVEVPPGDPDGSGEATITANPDQGEVCFDINVSGITLPATAAHIHIGAAGVAGDAVVPLTAPDASGASSGCVEAEVDVIEAILQEPSNYYLNVHTSDFPDGALRGQLADFG